MIIERENGLKRLFERHFREKARTISPLKAHGSGRAILRLSGDSATAVGVHGPDKKENAAFLGFSRHFRRSGLPVPEIYAEDAKNGLYLEEDLGDTTLFQYLSENRGDEGLPGHVLAVYEQAVRLLPKFQIEAGKTLDYRLCYPRPSFDRQSMRWDLNYFKYYFLRLAQIPFSEQALEDDFGRLADFLLQADRRYFLYRDFQSRNIMVKDGAPRFLDYQGGRRGALQYDIASLLFDAKADLPFEVRDRLLSLYLDAASSLARINRRKFLRHYPGYVSIRIFQAMGTYGLRGFYERKTLFLQSIPYAVRNLEHLLRAGGLPVKLPELAKVLKRLVGSSALRQYGGAELPLSVRVQSFSYRQGPPEDESGHGGGYVFDCRGLPNPGKYERYSKLAGKDPEVVSFLEDAPEVRSFLEHAFALVDQSVASYRGRNFTNLLVAFGCTGGQHRSVYCAERLAAHLREKGGVKVELSHPGLERLAASP